MRFALFMLLAFVNLGIGVASVYAMTIVFGVAATFGLIGIGLVIGFLSPYFFIRD